MIKNAVAAKADAYQLIFRLLARITMHAEGISTRVYIQIAASGFIEGKM